MPKSFLTLPVGYARVDNEPLMSDAVFDSYEEALNFAQNDPTAYLGQIISAGTDDGYQAYIIESDGTLTAIGSDSATVTELESKVESNTQSISSLESCCTEVQSTLTNVQNTVTELESKVKDAVTEVNEVAESVEECWNSLESNFTSMNEKLDAIIDYIGSKTGETCCDKVSDGIDAMEEKINSFQSILDEILSKV